MLWREGLSVVVTNVVSLRVQLVQSLCLGNFINVYRPTGKQGDQARRILFSHDLLTLSQTIFDEVSCYAWKFNPNRAKGLKIGTAFMIF